jgi:hypothetical protein
MMALKSKMIVNKSPPWSQIPRSRRRPQKMIIDSMTLLRNKATRLDLVVDLDRKSHQANHCRTQSIQQPLR